MNVIYEQQVRQKIEAQIAYAKDCGRTIKEIQLTKDEWEEFSGEVARLGQRDYGILNGVKITFDGCFG